MAKDLDLKKGVDFIGVTCVFFCYDGKGNILLHKRSKNCRDEHGRWDSGSGSMEFGETFEETVIREIREEYCVTPSEIQLCSTTNVIRMNCDQKTHWVANTFVAKIDDPENVKIGEPHKMDEIGWFPLAKFPQPLHSMLMEQLKLIEDSGMRIF